MRIMVADPIRSQLTREAVSEPKQSTIDFNRNRDETPFG